MKISTYCVIVLAAFFTLDSKAQMEPGIRLKGEYIPFSNYNPNGNGDSNTGKSDMRRIEGGIGIPLSVKLDSLGRPKIWAVSLDGSYASIKNRDFEKSLFPNELLNASIGLMHMRPMSKTWNIMFMASAGVYTNMKKINSSDVLAMGGVIFIKQFNPRTALGFGPVVSNSFGVPMILPAIYFTWKTEGKFQVLVNFPQRVEVGMKVNEAINLKAVGEISSMTADVDREDKFMLSYLQVVTGLRPEFKIGKSLSIELTGGYAVYRSMTFTSRKLSDFFKDKTDEKVSYFKPAPYGAVGIKWNFGKK